jgi:hypothetical protein
MAFMMLFSCQNDQTELVNPTTNAIARRGCASQEVLAAQLAADPTLAIRMNQIEAFTQKAMLTGRIVNGKIEILLMSTYCTELQLRTSHWHRFNHKLIY